MTRASHRFVTRCPACGSAFHVLEAQLSAAGGQVRCGQCLTAFDAHRHAVRPSPDPEPQPEAEDPVRLSALSLELEDDDLQLNDHSKSRVRDLEEPVDLPVRSARPTRLSGPRGWMTVAGLVLLLAVQVLWHDSDRLAANPATRPLITGLCGLLGCQPAPYRNLEALQSRNFSLRSITGQEDTLLLTLTIHNDDRHAQALPGLDLAFTNPDNRIVAARRFLPGEYLDPELLQTWQQQHGPSSLPELPAGGSMDVQLALADPGQEAVNYELAFSQP